METTRQRICDAQVECKVRMDTEAYMKGLRPELVDTVYAWACGKSFSDICKLCNSFEGSIIRVFRRLDELLNSLTMAAKSVGSSEIADKITEGILSLSHGFYILRVYANEHLQVVVRFEGVLFLLRVCIYELNQP